MSDLLQQIRGMAVDGAFTNIGPYVPLEDLERVLEGMVLVPREPTAAMLAASQDERVAHFSDCPECNGWGDGISGEQDCEKCDGRGERYVGLPITDSVRASIYLAMVAAAPTATPVGWK